MSADLLPAAYRVNLALKQVYVLMSNGHIHVWRMHSGRSPTLMSVWDKLTPNHKDLALSMTLMPRGQLDPLLAEMQGATTPQIVQSMQSNCVRTCRCITTEMGRLPFTLLVTDDTLNNSWAPGILERSMYNLG